MKKIKFAWLLVLSLLCSVPFTSCSDKDDEEPVQLSVSPSQLTLLSAKNSNATFNITSNKDWVITCDADWLSLSASSGSGNTPVLITALSDNASATDRVATVTVLSGEIESVVEVKQLAAYVADCKVEFTKILTMTTSVAFEFELGSKVNFFSFGWLKADAAGWTDDRIVEWLSSDDAEAFGNDVEGVYGLDDMRAGTTYYLVAIAYDSQGNRGELTKTQIVTPKASSSEPLVEIDDATVDASQWHWYTYPNARTHKYYMMALDGDVAYYARSMYSEAEMAALLKKSIDDGSIEPYANNSRRWSMNRTEDAMYLYVVTWGVGVSDNFANALVRSFWTVNSSSKAPARVSGAKNGLSDSPRLTHKSYVELEKTKSGVKIYSI